MDEGLLPNAEYSTILVATDSNNAGNYNSQGWCAGYELVMHLVHPIVITMQYRCNYSDPNITVNYSDLCLTALKFSENRQQVFMQSVFDFFPISPSLLGGGGYVCVCQRYICVYQRPLRRRWVICRRFFGWLSRLLAFLTLLVFVLAHLEAALH